MSAESKAGSVWTRSETLLLIKEFAKRPFLYQASHPDFLKIPKKRAAYLEIVQELKDVKENVDEVQVKNKIRTLTQQMRQEKHKMRKKSEMGSEEVFRSSLWCFEELSFLLNANDENDSTASVSVAEVTQSNELCELEEEPQPKKKKSDNQMEKLVTVAEQSMEMIASLSNKSQSPIDAFCRFIASEMKHLKYEESIDKLQMMILSDITKIKQEERQMHRNPHSWRYGSELSATRMPIPFESNIQCSDNANITSNTSTSSEVDYNYGISTSATQTTSNSKFSVEEISIKQE
ncbi:uncharacterized protein LOC119682011 [Teleopsis dalmanni]|uniref:uncharacterized protein LOC119682011 n=1 Tax=Teleopsis dalmanni TaxID=139649 RepID=UPI0018CD928B|nr:uncharacterized protein LOC119682011 [Teleopsis dalmanni]